jgi:hypothetical protein
VTDEHALDLEQAGGDAETHGEWGREGRKGGREEGRKGGREEGGKGRKVRKARKGLVVSG